MYMYIYIYIYIYMYMYIPHQYPHIPYHVCSRRARAGRITSQFIKGGFSKKGYSHFIRKSTGKVSHTIRKFAAFLAPSNKHRFFIRITFANSPKTPFCKTPFDYLSTQQAYFRKVKMKQTYPDSLVLNLDAA